MAEKWRDFAVTFRYDKDELNRWLRQSDGQKKKYQIMLLILALLAANFLIVIPTAENKVPSVLMAVVCVALFVFVLVVSRSRKGAQTVEALYRGGAEYHVFLYQDRIVRRVEGTQESIPMQDVAKALEHERHFSIQYPGGALLLPKDAVGDAQCAALSHQLEEELGARYRLCNR